MIITDEIIDDIALGASVLGVGGGGDPYAESLMAKCAIANAKEPVRLLSMDEVDDDWMTVPASTIGAPSVAVEKLLSDEQILTSFDAMQDLLGEPIRASYPLEIAGGIALQPIVLAAQRGIHVVDCDGMGRAFPESQMTTFYLEGVQSAPNTLSDEKGNVVVLYPIDGLWSERLARPVTDAMGGTAAMYDYSMRGSTLKRAALWGTVTKAMTIGRTIRQCNADGSDAVQALLDMLQGHRLITGKIVDLDRKIVGGFVRGTVTIEPLSPQTTREKTTHVHFQNELLLAHNGKTVDDYDDSNILAVTPDLISILDHENGHPIHTENLHYGQRVDLMGYPCDPKWRTPKGIEVGGPAYFGYNTDYYPVEELNKNQ